MMFPSTASFLGLASLLVSTATVLAEGIYLAPPTSSSGEPKLMVFIQGAQIPNDRYTDILREIQAQAPYPLHVLVPNFILDLAIPMQSYIHSRIQDALSESLPGNVKSLNLPIILAGHSIGANAVQLEAAANPSSYIASVIFGASVERKYNSAFPMPILAVNGELDGLQRVSRVAEAAFNSFDRRKIDISADSVAAHPIVVINGMNHLQFADGINPPLVVASLDLQAAISLSSAHQQVAEAVNQFLCLQPSISASCPQDIGQISLQDKVTTTRQFLGPMIEAFRMEGSPNLFTPCNSDKPSPHCPYYPAWPLQSNRVPSPDTDCICGLPFSSVAVQVMSGLDPALFPLTSVDAIHDVSDTNPYHHAHIWTNCTETPNISAENPCLVNSTTVSMIIYPSDSDDTGFPKATADELRIKMNSRQLYAMSTTNASASLEQYDAGNICRDINQKSYDWAMSMASPVAQARFQLYGQPMVMVDDGAPLLPIGPLFIDYKLGLKDVQVNGKWELQVQGVGFETPQVLTGLSAAFAPPDSNGYHYCKVLSPARVMEHIMVDGLRKEMPVGNGHN